MNAMPPRDPRSGATPVPFQPQPPELEQGFDLRGQIDILRRRWLVALPVAVVIAALIFSFSLFEQPKFTATALVMMSPQREQVVQTEDVLSGVPLDTAAIESEIEIIRSRLLAERVVDALDLAESPVWNPALREVPLGEQIRGTVMGVIRAPIAWMRPRAPEDPTLAPTGEAVSVDPAREAAIRAVQGSVRAQRRRLSYVIEVSVTAIDPRQAALVANALVDAYMDAQLEARFDAAQRANSWLSDRLRELREEVQAKEAAVEQYRAQTGIVDVQGGTLAEQQVTTLQASVISARADLAEKEARLRQVQQLVAAGSSAEAIGNLIGSPTILDLRRQEGDVQRRQADLEGRYGELHPEVQKVRVERSDIRRQIESEIARIVANLENEAQVARTRVATLQSSTSSIKGEILSNNRQLIQLRELERDAQATRAVYESFLQRFEEIDAQGSLQVSNARVVSDAIAPSVASSPQLQRAMLIAVLLGLIVGVGLAYLLEMLDDVLGSPDDVARKVGAPALATIPVVAPSELRKLPEGRRDPPNFIVDKPMSAYAEALRVLRTTILYSNVDVTPRIVAVTSAAPGEGKTTTAMGLARIAAAAGQRVLVIDCDLRRQSLRSFVPQPPEIGILQVLAGEATWRDAVVPDPDSDAQLLLATAASFTPRDVFGSDAMGRLLQETAEAYDLVICDCAPVLAVAETRVVARRADATILVARWGKTPARSVRSAYRYLNEAGAEVLGVVINCLNPQSARSGYYDAPYYAKKYQNYYVN